MKTNTKKEMKTNTKKEMKTNTKKAIENKYAWQPYVMHTFHIAKGNVFTDIIPGITGRLIGVSDTGKYLVQVINEEEYKSAHIAVTLKDFNTEHYYIPEVYQNDDAIVVAVSIDDIVMDLRKKFR